MKTAKKNQRPREWTPVKCYPTHSAVIGNLPSKPLTDRAIEAYALEGRYGSDAQKFYEAKLQDKQKLKIKKRQKEKQVKRLVDELLN
jgi:hypothetical protein